MSNVGFSGQRGFTSSGSLFNAVQFIVRMLTGAMATATLVQVKAVYGGGESALATVDVLPLVNQVDSLGNATPHGIVPGLPAFRLQGGNSAIICDPVVGDIGIGIFCSRDISSVKKNKAQSNPGSFRRFDYADGCYLGIMLGDAPTQWIEFLASAAGIKVNTPGNFIIDAANCTLDASGNLQVKGEVTRGVGTSSTVTLGGHTHTQAPDSHGDTEEPTSAPTTGT